MFGKDTLKTPKQKPSNDIGFQIKEIENKILELQKKREQNNATSDKRLEFLKPKPGVAEKGAAKRMQNATKKLHSENNSIIKQIAALEKKKQKLLDKKKLRDAEAIYAKEYGGIEMENIYTNEDIDKRRLKLYEALHEGVITESQFNTLNDELADAIDLYNESIDQAEIEEDSVVESVEDPTADTRLFLYESVRKGTLSSDECAVMLENL